MIYCITKALISTQNKNLLLESKLNDVLKSSKENQALRISKEHSNSDTLFNDPYHFKQKCIKNIEAFV